MGNRTQLPTRKPGRPKRDPMDNCEQHVAKSYDALVSLRQEFNEELTRQFPALSPESRADVAQLVLAAAEEYRLWSSVDNQLLSIQRHHTPTEQLTAKSTAIGAKVAQLAQTYQLIFIHRNGEPFREDCFLHADYETVRQQLVTLSYQPLAIQTPVLYAFALWIERQAGSVTFSPDVPQLRRLLRLALLAILNHRLGMVYKRTAQPKVGRPELPLPVAVVRAEQAVIDDYKKLSAACMEKQLIPLSPEQLWIKHRQTAPKTKIGRKPLNPQQTIQRDLRQMRQQLARLEASKAEIIAKEQVSQGKKGRKPTPYRKRHHSLTSKIAELEKRLKKHSGSG
ncbi:hypothetical protein [Vibrio sp. CAU 1672]|uniref:hypothetical protein n=1 Tax=Vibrio sp. CAU 1672 TaxID=3032594 RepID=UPI0023DCE5D0|nr:hypothetical protein [Vibrio sp. CAU 1672]MDF2154598.1 hypothetical protein [Vibrio sp. CAU 1672]